MAKRNYWIGVIARDHVRLGVQGGFAQLNHGKKEPLLKLHAGDGLVFYSPKDHFPDGEPVQNFTGIGFVKDGQVYQGPGGPDPMPYRIDIQFVPANEVPIRPLIDQLTFIVDKTHWGAPFRYGNLMIPEQDFRTIAAAMGVDFDQELGKLGMDAPTG